MVIMRENRELKISPSNTNLPWIFHLLWDILSHCIPFLINLSCCFFPCASTKKQKEEVVPTLTVGAGAPSAVVSVVFPGTRQGPALCPPLTDRSASTWACRCCSAVPMRWRSSVTWAQQTLPRAFGWVWSSEAPRARMTALWVAAVTSPVDPATACWSVPAESPTVASTVLAWWTKTAEDYRNQSGAGWEENLIFWLSVDDLFKKSFKFKLKLVLFGIAHYFLIHIVSPLYSRGGGVTVIKPLINSSNLNC